MLELAGLREQGQLGVPEHLVSMGHDDGAVGSVYGHKTWPVFKKLEIQMWPFFLLFARCTTLYLAA